MEARLPNIVLLVFFAGLAGANGCLAQTLTTLAHFSASTTGDNPAGPLTVGSDGNLYGLTRSGGSESGGTAFKLTPGGSLSALYGFCFQAQCTDGHLPTGGLIQGTDGNFYGTTSSGGQHNEGEVFRISPSGNIAVLYSFCSQANSTCPDGSDPGTTLLQGSDGNFYGTTESGGSGSSGTVFQLTPSGVLTTLYTFCTASGCPDGSDPSGLVAAADGLTFYGTTESGGKSSRGTVFKITSGGTFTTLYSFCSETGCADGEYPSTQAGLTFGKDGNLYGTTTSGGFNGNGTVFKVSTAGTIATLYSFCGVANCPDGYYPYWGLLLGADGNFYGSALLGGTGNVGTIFKITPAGVYTTLYTFCPSTNNLSYCADGEYPGPLVQTANGTLYGVTYGGGDANGDGTAFKLSIGSPARTALGAQVDYFGTGAADFSVFRPSTGYFYSLSPADVSSAQQWGLSTDIPVTGDYDGDGKTDIAVYRPSSGVWYIHLSSNNQNIVQQFGLPTDIPVVGDFDGDGKTDIAVYRPSSGVWYIIMSSNNVVVQQQFGAPTDIPVVGDFDGDGKSDIAVYRPSTGYWYILASDTNEIIAHQWGAPSDLPAPGYYDGDAKTDIAVYRPSTGTWYIVQSSNGAVVTPQLGQTGDVPVARDYDGDGKTDVAVYRPSTGVWYFVQSSTGELVGRQWGGPGDIPLNSAEH